MNYVHFALLPPGWRGETAFLVRDGRPELRWGKEKQRTRTTERARRAMSGGPVEPTGRGHGCTGCTAGTRTENTAGCSIYTGPLCAFLGALPALAPALFVFVHTSGRSVRGKRVEWQIMSTLCLGFDKYLLATSSIPFHFTNKLEIHWPLHYYRAFFIPSSCVWDGLKIQLSLVLGQEKKIPQMVKVITLNTLHGVYDVGFVYANEDSIRNI